MTTDNPIHAEAAADETAASHAELVLEREKIELERERLALERERLAAEREKWKADAVWKNRSEGRFGISLGHVALMGVICVVVGSLVGAVIIWRDARTMRERRFSSLVLRSVGSETNEQGVARSPLVLQRVESVDDVKYGDILILD